MLIGLGGRGGGASTDIAHRNGGSKKPVYAERRRVGVLETAAGVSAGVGLDPRGEAWVRSSMTRGASGGVGKAQAAELDR